MALTPEEKEALEALQAKAKEPDPEDFEIEIYASDGRGARVPYHKGRKFLQEAFGIDLDPDPEQEVSDGSATGKSQSANGKGKAGTDKGSAEGDGERRSHWSRTGNTAG